MYVYIYTVYIYVCTYECICIYSLPIRSTDIFHVKGGKRTTFSCWLLPYTTLERKGGLKKDEY